MLHWRFGMGGKYLKLFAIVVICWCLTFSLSTQAETQWQVEAIEFGEMPDELSKNINGTLKPLLNQPFTQSLESKLLSQTERALQALGYYQANITLSRVEQSSTLKIDAEVGEPIRWKSIQIEIKGEANKDSFLQKVLSGIPIKANGIVNHDNYEQTKSLLESSLISKGYFDFKWLNHRLEIHKQKNFAVAKLKLDSGNRYRFGKVEVSRQSLAKKYIQSLAPFDENTLYDETLLSEYNLALNKTPYFSAIKVYPQLQNRKNNLVPIRIEVVDKPANTFEVGGGFSTEIGAKARFKWSKPWITEDGHFFDGNLFVAEKQQRVTGSYSIPVSNPNDDLWRVTTGYALEDELTEGVDSKIWNVQLQRQWLTSNNWIRTAFLKREHETTTQDGETDKTEMLIPGISYAKKQAVGGVTPSWGQQTLISLEFASEDLISSTSLFKVQLEQAWLRKFALKHWFIARLDAGAIVTDDINEVPFNLRFFAGGDQSIRGFAYQSVAPYEEGKIIGGKYLATASVEYNYQFMPNWRLALFVDSGTATNDFSESWAVGAGFGIRYITPVGPIRLDHAWGLSKESKSTRLSIIIGPEI